MSRALNLRCFHPSDAFRDGARWCSQHGGPSHPTHSGMKQVRFTPWLCIPRRSRRLRSPGVHQEDDTGEHAAGVDRTIVPQEVELGGQHVPRHQNVSASATHHRKKAAPLRFGLGGMGWGVHATLVFPSPKLCRP